MKAISLVALATLCGCGLTVGERLEKTHQSLKSLSSVAETMVRSECQKAAKQCFAARSCPAQVTRAQVKVCCPALAKCWTIRTAINGALIQAHRASAIALAYDAAGKKDKARAMLPKIFEAMADVQTLLVSLGVLK